MSFMPDKQEKGLQGWEYIPAAAGSYEVGQALTVSGGKVAKIGAALKTTPNYVSVARKVLADGENLPVMRVKPDIIWQTELSAETAGAVVGAKLEVSAGGMAVDGTAAGTFEVVYAQGTEAGSKVTGRFV